MYLNEYNQLNLERLNWQTEEEVRLGWLHALREKLNIVFHAERGRSDADYNQVIIEFKNKGLFHSSVNSPKFIEALEELSRYIPAKAQQEGISVQNYVGIVIDGDSIAFAHITHDNNIIHGPIMPLSPASVSMVFEACKNSCRRALTAENLIEDFGHGSTAGSKLMQALAGSLDAYLEEPENNKIKMLYMEWKALYGQVADLSSFQMDAIMNAIGFVYPAGSPDRLSRILFVIHTFNSIVIKLLAAEIVSQITSLTAYSDFAQNTLSESDTRIIEILDRDIEHSQLYSRAHIHGFVEEPLFSWYIDICKDENRIDTTQEMVQALKEVLIRLTFYQMEDLLHAQTNDVLKRFYQNIVPQVLRKSLGEFYTPDWLVEVSLDKVEGDFSNLRFLDPTCGSASFLLAIIKRMRENTELSAVELLERITDNVWGFDLNPLAVQTARVNYLIAISDLIMNAPGIDIEIPILLADAIYSPAPDPEQDENTVNYVIGSNVANLTITLPSELAKNRERLDKVFEIMGRCVDRNIDVTCAMEELVDCQAISIQEKEQWEELLSATYLRVLDLHRRNWNGIWFRIVRNYFWSSTAGEFDVIVGNPPWVRWSKLPELYRNRVMPTCRRYDIFSATPFYGGNELDISGLITYTVSDKWLKNGGTLIFLITQTHFQSASSAGFRQFNIHDQTYLKPCEVEDLKALKPFPDAANKTAIFVAKKGAEGPHFPINYYTWDRAPGKTRTIPEYASKQEVLSRIIREQNEANPVGESNSPWAILPPGEFELCKKLIGKCAWAEGRKGITCDLNGVYLVNVVNVSHDGSLVQIETRPEAGRTNIGPKQRFWVEPTLLYPVVKGAGDLDVCSYNPQHTLCAIVPNRGIAGEALAQVETTVERNNPNLFRYFQTFESQLKKRSTYRTRMPKAPFYSVYNVGEYTFSPWKVIWPEQPGNSGLPVAVVNTRRINGLGDKIVVPDHKIYFAEFNDPTLAYYLCGILSCSLVQKFVKSFHVMLQVGDIFKFMRLPEYNATDERHVRLVDLAQEANNESNQERRLLLVQEISAIGDEIIANWEP